jgi:hypothetical protein
MCGNGPLALIYPHAGRALRDCGACSGVFQPTTHCHGRGRGFDPSSPPFIPKGRHGSVCSREEGSHCWCRDCYTQRVDSYFGDIALYQSLPVTSVQQLIESGFMIIPGPVLSPRLPELSSAYDEVMNSGASPDFKVGSTTTRMYYLVNRGRVFDDLYTYPLFSRLADT